MATRIKNTNLDAKISNPLERLRGLIRLFVSFDVVLFAGLFLVIWFLSWVAFDYGVFKAAGIDYALYSHWGLRLAFIALMLTILVAYIGVRVYRLLNKDLSYTSLALVLEKRHPELLRDRLITAIELSDLDKAEAQGYSREMIQQTIDEAHERVGQVNVRSVLRWKRLWSKVILASILLVLFAGFGFAAHAISTKAFDPNRGGHKLADVSSIWAERNLLLKNTPWPRRSHIELVEFPESGELRQGKDAGAPRIRARAYQWVIADRSRTEGWRPLKMSDLDRPAFGIAPVDLSNVTLTDAYGKATQVNLSEATLDDVEGTLSTEHELVKPIFEKLNILSDDVWMSRTLRKLVLPKEMILTFTGARSAGISNLTRDPNGEYSGEVNGIKENRVSFVVRGEDYRTMPRFIELIPPPMLIDLRRNEYQPAYLYYPAPIDKDQASLRGLKQLFADQKISLTSEKSVFPVPTGTDVEIMATADKPLRKVTLSAKGDNKKLWEKSNPGDGFEPVLGPVRKDGGKREVLGWEKSSATGFENFTILFRGGDAIRETVEFDYILTDLDSVSAKRSITIQVNEDQPPLVEVGVDVLRKVGSSHMCTPIAMIPFLSESRIADDTGLSKVEYEFTYTKAESSIVSTVQAGLAGGLASAFGGPMRSFGTIGVIAGNRVVFERIGTKSEQKQFGSAPVDRFTVEYSRLTRDTMVKLEQSLKVTRDRGLLPGVVKLIKFTEGGDDVFDLRENLKSLLVPDTEIQPRYKIELNITATDVNTELSGKDGTALPGKKSSNVEPIRLLVVSEGDLLAEILKDEENQTVKLDEILKRIVDCESKLSQELSLLSSPSPNQLSSSAVRALDILQDVNKSKDQLASVLIDYERLYREIVVNRCNAKLLEKYRNDAGQGIIQETKRILDGTNPEGSFPQAETALGAFQGTLNGARVPPQAEADNARVQLSNLRNVLGKLRSLSGSLVDISKARKDLLDLIQKHLEIEKDVIALREKELERVKSPLITSNKPITIQVGKTVTVKHAIDWKLYAQGQLAVYIEAPADADLQLPKDLTIKDDKNEFSYDVTAGMKPGNYTLKIKPFVGNTVDQQIIVTK
jgi:septum formation topological specificity factor MinE